MTKPIPANQRAQISRSIPRIDAKDKAEGREPYIDDFSRDGLVHARFVRSTVSRGKILELRIPELPEGYEYTDRMAVPGVNRIALIKSDWPAFAEDEVRYRGQIIGVLAGPDPAVLDELLSRFELVCDELPTAIGLDAGLACVGGPIHGDDNIYADLTVAKGDVDAAFASAHRIIEGSYETGFQEQMYMEPQGLVVTPLGNGSKVKVHGSMQCPFYVKHAVEHVLGDGYDVQAVQATTGGGFGGKEDYPEIMGAPLAVAALAQGRALHCVFDRSEDLLYTSKRHPSRIHIRSAVDEKGYITAMDYDILLDGGAYESYTLIVLQRAMFTCTGVYNFPAVRIHGRGVATSTVPSGAFRGFGAPQAIFALERHMDHLAAELGRDPLAIRRPLFLKQGDPTVTGGMMRDEIILDQLVDRGRELSGYDAKMDRYAAASAAGAGLAPGERGKLKGIGMSMFVHGCGFTGDGEQAIIKGRVKIRKSAEGRVSILVASIDMGQGPKTTFRKIAGIILGIEPEKIDFDNPDTDIVPDSGPTVASRTIMVVGYLVQQAAEKLRDSWEEGREQETEARYSMPPGLKWDQNLLSGDAYGAFGWGVNVVEVEVDPVSYEVETTGVWALYDVGVPIDERVVHGQIQGGMSQALGYAYLEKLDTDEAGVFRQVSMADYIVPTSLDFPRTVSETIDNPYQFGPFGAKGMGEIVHDGGHAAFAGAVEQAIGKKCHSIPLSPERIMELAASRVPGESGGNPED
jgi:CO/xanthine dehydrogenase Mo-binding subunit